MPTFRTPTTKEYLGKYGLWGRTFLERGISVLKEGSSYRQVTDPTPEDISSATYAYLGGRSYEITSEESADLTAAGYGAWIT